MTRLLCVIVLVACGPKASDPAQPTPHTSDPRPEPHAGSQASEAKPHSRDDRCTKLIDHVVTLAVAERPADQKPSADERASIAKQLETAWTPKCDGMTSKGYDCAVNAQTLTDLDRCGG